MSEQLNNNNCSTVYVYLGDFSFFLFFPWGISKDKTGYSTLRHDHIRVADLAITSIRTALRVVSTYVTPGKTVAL